MAANQVNDVGMQKGSAPNTVIVNQPTAGDVWMLKPDAAANCPPGLEYLTLLDQVLVHQKKSLVKILIDWETRNKFTVKNAMGQITYKAIEISSCMTRYCFGSIRPYEMEIRNNFDQEVIHLYRRLACQSCCYPCYLQKLEVFSPPGTLIGTVEQEWSIIYPKFRICDSFGNAVLWLKGPFITSSCCCNDVVFKVLSDNEQVEVGKICKQWSGFVNEVFTDADHFGITFPIDLDVRIKAVLLGAVFLINSMYYERK